MTRAAFSLTYGEIEHMSTTTTEKSVKVLNELIAICEDGAQGFAKAAEDVRALPLHTLFSSYSTQRTSYAAELRREVALLGEKPEETGHAAAARRRPATAGERSSLSEGKRAVAARTLSRRSAV